MKARYGLRYKVWYADHKSVHVVIVCSSASVLKHPNELFKERMGGTHTSDSHPIFWNSVMQDLLASCYGFEDVSIVVCV